MAKQLSKEVAAALLEKLSTDDDFRAHFARNPRAALRSLGHETPQEDHDVKGRDPVLAFTELRGGLASKETIAAQSGDLLAAYDPDAETNLLSEPFTHCAA